MEQRLIHENCDDGDRPEIRLINNEYLIKERANNSPI
jgi:hypothetical protein